MSGIKVKKGCKYEVVGVYEGNHIFTKCFPNLKKARQVGVKNAMAKMRRKPETGDGFIEIRELGDFEFGDFDSIQNFWPDDIWTGPEYYDPYGRRPGNKSDQERHMKLLGEQRERQERSRR